MILDANISFLFMSLKFDPPIYVAVKQALSRLIKGAWKIYVIHI